MDLRGEVMKRLFAFCAIILFSTSVVFGQSTSETKTICKDSPIPEGYSIVGETQVKECPKSAWIVQRRRTPKMTNDGVVGSLNKPTAAGMDSSMNALGSPIEKLFGSPAADTASEGVKPAKPAATPQWKKIFPAKDEFSVMLPSPPEHYDGAKVGAPLDLYMSAVGNDRYLLMSMKAPDVMDESQQKQALDGFSAGFMNAMKRRENTLDNTKLTFDRDINIIGLLGKQFSVETPEGKGTFRVYVSKQRLYFLGAIGSSNSDVFKFLDSFRLVPR
jgi:hypothetical protein